MFNLRSNYSQKVVTTHSYQTLEEFGNYQNLETKQLSTGFIGGQTTLINLQDILLIRKKADVDILITENLHDSYEFILPLIDTTFFGDGKIINESRLMIFNGDSNSYTIIPKGMDYIILSIRVKALSKYLPKNDETLFTNLIKSNQKNNYNSFYIKQLIQFIYQIYLRIYVHQSFDSFSQENYCKLIILYLFEFLIFQKEKVFQQDSNYERIMTRSIDYINANNSNDIDLNQLSSAVFSNKRSIQYAFSKCINMTPIQFIRSNRLNIIRKEIISSKSNKTFLTNILSKHEISNHSRFIKEYNTFFNG